MIEANDGFSKIKKKKKKGRGEGLLLLLAERAVSVNETSSSVLKDGSMYVKSFQSSLEEKDGKNVWPVSAMRKSPKKHSSFEGTR